MLFLPLGLGGPPLLLLTGTCQHLKANEQSSSAFSPASGFPSFLPAPWLTVCTTVHVLCLFPYPFPCSGATELKPPYLFAGKYKTKLGIKRKLSFQYEVNVSLGKVSLQTITEEEDEWLLGPLMEELLCDGSCAFITGVNPGRGYEQNAEEISY